MSVFVKHGGGEVRCVQMLDRISEVQMVHNRQKTVAMHELLDHGAGEQASTVGDTFADDA